MEGTNKGYVSISKKISVYAQTGHQCLTLSASNRLSFLPWVVSVCPPARLPGFSWVSIINLATLLYFVWVCFRPTFPANWTSTEYGILIGWIHIASQIIILATQSCRADASGDIVHQSANVMPRLGLRSGIGKGQSLRVAGDGRGQVVVCYDYLIPFWTERFTWDLGEQLLAFAKQIQKSWERKKMKHQNY